MKKLMQKMRIFLFTLMLAFESVLCTLNRRNLVSENDPKYNTDFFNSNPSSGPKNSDLSSYLDKLEKKERSQNTKNDGSKHTQDFTSHQNNNKANLEDDKIFSSQVIKRLNEYATKNQISKLLHF